MRVRDEEISAFVLRLRAVDTRKATTIDVLGVSLQSLFLSIVGAADQWFSEALHGHASAKAFTIGVIVSESYRGRLTVRVTCLRRMIADALRRGTEAIMLDQASGHTALRAGGIDLVLEALICEEHEWGGRSTIQTLFDESAEIAPSAFGLEFVTPFHAYERDVSGERLIIAPQLDARTVFTALQRRTRAVVPLANQPDWDKLYAALEHVETYDWDGVQRVTYMIKAGREHPIEEAQRPATIGRVWFHCQGSDEQRQLLYQLAQAAFYLGVGAHTALGMGMARVIEPREAPVWRFSQERLVRPMPERMLRRRQSVLGHASMSTRLQQSVAVTDEE